VFLNLGPRVGIGKRVPHTPACRTLFSIRTPPSFSALEDFTQERMDVVRTPVSLERVTFDKRSPLAAKPKYRHLLQIEPPPTTRKRASIADVPALLCHFDGGKRTRLPG